MQKEYEVMFIFNSQEKIYQEAKKQVESLFKEFKVKIFDQVDLGVKKFCLSNQQTRSRALLHLLY